MDNAPWAPIKQDARTHVRHTHRPATARPSTPPRTDPPQRTRLRLAAVSLPRAAAAMSARCCVLLAAAGVALLALPGALGHGYLSEPMSRNLLKNNDFTLNRGLAYNANQGNGRAISLGLLATGQPGVCGDPWQTLEAGAETYRNYFGSLPWGAAFPAGASAPLYSPGQRVRFTWVITAGHGGYFGFKICPRRDSLDQACFDANVLQRADGLGPHVWHPTGGAGSTMSAEFIIPNVNCPDGCVLQWEYHTGNSCAPRCVNPTACASYDKFGVLSPCGSAGAPVAERFQNCADIRVSGTPSGCTTPCPTANECQTGGGCNTATRTCIPIANRPDGTACSSGTCRSGACAATGCTTPCPTANECQTGGGCNTATRTCIPIANRPDGTACSSGTCRSGTCGGTCARTAALGGNCGAGTCCPTGQCCSQWGWCGTT